MFKIFTLQFFIFLIFFKNILNSILRTKITITLTLHLVKAAYFYNYPPINTVASPSPRSADIAAVDNFHWTALHFACHAGLMDLIVLLIERGADIDAVTMNGATPFMRAVESSRPDCVQYLIDAGAKIQTENRKGIYGKDVFIFVVEFRKI